MKAMMERFITGMKQRGYNVKTLLCRDPKTFLKATEYLQEFKAQGCKIALLVFVHAPLWGRASSSRKGFHQDMRLIWGLQLETTLMPWSCPWSWRACFWLSTSAQHWPWNTFIMWASTHSTHVAPFHRNEIAKDGIKTTPTVRLLMVMRLFEFKWFQGYALCEV